MAELAKIVTVTAHATVTDLNEVASATGIRLLRIYAPDQNTWESVLFSPDAPGATLLKQQEQWVQWTAKLRIPAQNTTAGLITKINAVGNGFRSSSNAFMIQRESEASPRYFSIISTTINGATAKDLEVLQFNIAKQITEWEFVFRTHPYAQGSSTPAWY